MSPLHDHQERAVEFMLRTPKCALWMQLGSGKTRAVIQAVTIMLDAIQVKRVLIVAPLRVALSVWPDEIDRWSGGRVSYGSIRGEGRTARSAQQRCEFVRDDKSDIHLINHDNLTHLVDMFRGGRRLPYDMVILDESTVFKNVSSRRFKELRKWFKRGKVDRVVQLSATPAPNSLIDLWAQLYLLDGGARLGESKGSYIRRCFVKSGDSGRLVPRAGARKWIHNAVSDICFTTKIADAATVEAPEIVDVLVPLKGEAAKKYETLEEKFVLKLDDVTIMAGTAAVLTNKLRQAVTGGIYYEQGVWRDMHDLRLERLRGLVDEANGEPVAIAYGYRLDIERIKRVLPHAELLGHGVEQVARWNRGEIPVMLFHPASAGHGLNLQHGGRRLIWYVLPWSLEHYQQAIGRFARQGQKHRVIVHRLRSPDTIEDAVIDALRGKDRTQTALLDYVTVRRTKDITPDS